MKPVKITTVDYEVISILAGNLSIFTKNQNKMDQQKVDLFIMTNAKFFEGHHLGWVREQLLQMDDAAWPQVQMMQFKDPTTYLIVSLLGGSLGIDRFMLGDTGLGIGKLLTCGGAGIWAIIDWFMIMPATREKNMLMFQRLVTNNPYDTISTV
jgi:TM2 domain-containing membrane protein YozV